MLIFWKKDFFSNTLNRFKILNFAIVLRAARDSLLVARCPPNQNSPSATESFKIEFLRYPKQHLKFGKTIIRFLI